MKKSFGQENEFISDFIQQGVSTFFWVGLVHNMNLKNMLWNRCGLSTTLSNETSATNQALSEELLVIKLFLFATNFVYALCQCV